MRSFSFKNFILLAGTVMLSLIILGAAFVLIGRDRVLGERKEALESNVIELSRYASAYARDGDLTDWDFRITLSSIAKSTGNHCFLTQDDGVIFVCSDTALDCGHLGLSVPAEVMRSLESSGCYSALTRLDGIYSDASYVAALPVPAPDGTILAYVFAASSTSSIIRAWDSLLQVFLITAFAILLLAFVLSFFIARLNARPINEMADAALKFAHGDFSVRVTEGKRNDEIGALAASFNQLAETLENSERRRSDFVANVAHELKTPMTTISGFADGILDGTIPQAQQAKYLSIISSETKRLNRLVRSMLELSRIQSAGRETLLRQSFDAVDVLTKTLVLFEQKITARSLNVDLMIPEDPMLVYGDADAINQVIYNLLENAIKFSTPGSDLGVSLFKRGEKAYFSIKNHGDTIPPDELALIFDRFHKTDKSRSRDRDGYGLGLYIVKTILNNHGEDITVTSRDGVTDFVFSLTLKVK